MSNNFVFLFLLNREWYRYMMFIHMIFIHMIYKVFCNWERFLANRTSIKIIWNSHGAYSLMASVKLMSTADFIDVRDIGMSENTEWRGSSNVEGIIWTQTLGLSLNLSSSIWGEG